MLLALVADLLPAVFCTAPAEAVTLSGTERVSVASDGSQGNQRSRKPSVSADGRFVAFGSAASNLVPGDTNAREDVFVRDRTTGTVTRVSVSSSGAQANGDSEVPTISASGRYVVFESSASNLALPSSSGRSVFLHDRQAGTTELVALDNTGQWLGSTTGSGAVSDDGRRVVFHRWSDNHVYLRDRVSATITDLTAGANGTSMDPRITPDGRHVVFDSSATNLVAGDTNAVRDVFAIRLDTSTTTRISVASGGTQATGGDSLDATVSDDGRYVAFESHAADLVAGDTNGLGDVFVHDRATGSTQRVSTKPNGGQSVRISTRPVLSGDGRFVTFDNEGTDLVAGFGVSGRYATYLKYRPTGTVGVVSKSTTGGSPNQSVSVSGVSAHGREVVFATDASNVVPSDTNGLTDAFLARVDTGVFVDVDEDELLGRRDSGGYAEDPVNTATGNFTDTVVDLDFPATVSGLGWSRTHNSRSRATGALGQAWTHAFADRVTEDPAGNVSLTAGDGRVVRFPRSGSGFARPAEFRGTLTKNADGTWTITRDDGRADAFATSGQLISRTFWDGQTVTLTYSGSNLAAVAHSTGRSLALAYSVDRLSSVTADDGRSVAYGYDGDGDLSTASPTDGGTTTYTTDSAGRITKVTDPDGVETVANTFDAQGRVATQTTASGDTVSFAYDYATGNTTLTRTGSGAVVVYGHDRRGRLTSVADPFGEVVTKTWNSAGFLTSTTDRRGGGVTTTYDAHGNPLTRTEPEGVSVSFAWDASDRLTSTTNGESETTTFAYDGTERVPSTVTDPEGGVTTYDVAGGLVESVTDADGVTLDLAWDAERNLTGVTDENGDTTSFAHDGAGNRTSATTPLGHETTRSWDGRRRVTSTTDAEGAVRSWAWSAGGKLTTATDAEDNDTTYAYDDAGRLHTVTDALGKVTTHAYDLDGNLTSVTRPGGAVTTMTYDDMGRCLTETDPTGVTLTNGHDEDGNGTTTTDENGKTVTKTYDLRGRVTTTTDQLGKDTDFTYDDADRLLTVTDALSGVTSLAYDDAGRVLSRTMPDGGVWARAWTPAGRPDTETDPNGHTTDHAYDAVGRLDTTTDPLGGVTDVDFDADGRLVSTTTPEGLTTTYAYDDADRLLSTTAPTGQTTTRAWTPRGQLASVTTPGWLASTRSFAYDALGRLTTATDAKGKATSWTYDDRGNWLTRTDAKGGVASATWDLADRMTSTTDPLNRTTAYTYDGLGRLSTVADPSGRSVILGHDDAGRVTSRTYGAGTVVALGYDDLGRRTSLTDATGTTTFGFDPVGRPTSVAYPSGKTLGFAWDDAGNRTGLTYPDGSTASFTYDAADRLTGIAHPDAAGGVAYGYDDDGRLLTESLPGSVSRAYAWGAGRLVTYAEARPEGTRTTTLGYDPADRIVSETTGGAVVGYGYDAAGQLTSVTRGTGPTASTTTYGYDDTGNRTSKTRGNTQTLYSYDAAQQLTTAARKVAGHTVETVNLTHDGAGRLTSVAGTAGSRTLAYDPRGVLASVTTTTGAGPASLTTTTNRTTDGEGRLVSAATTAQLGSATTGFTWDPSLPVPEVATTSTGGADTNHLYGMGRALALRSGQSDTYAQDAFGSTLAIGEASDLARAESYDEFGVPRSGAAATLLDEVTGLTGSGGDAAPRFGYRGETHLDGMVHLRARDYAPGLGRFTTVDPLDGVAGETTVANPYHYADNDPLDKIDPLGLSPLTDMDLRHPLTGLTFTEWLRFKDCVVSAYVGAGPWGADCGSLRSTVQMRMELVLREAHFATGLFTEWQSSEGQDIFPAGYFEWSDAERVAWLRSHEPLTLDELSDSVVGAVLGVKGGGGSAADDVVVLGKYPDYLTLADDLGARAFNVPTAIWDTMSAAQQWEANVKFLDEAVTRGSEFRLATSALPLEELTGYFAREVNYLMKKGYVLSGDGFRLLPPGG